MGYDSLASPIRSKCFGSQSLALEWEAQGKSGAINFLSVRGESRSNNVLIANKRVYDRSRETCVLIVHWQRFSFITVVGNVHEING